MAQEGSFSPTDQIFLTLESLPAVLFIHGLKLKFGLIVLWYINPCELIHAKYCLYFIYYTHTHTHIYIYIYI